MTEWRLRRFRARRFQQHGPPAARQSLWRLYRQQRGTLLQATSLKGLWTTVSGTTSPDTEPTAATVKFYRVFVSN